MMKKLTDTMIWDNSEIEFYQLGLALKRLPAHADRMATALRQLGQAYENMSPALQTVYRALEAARKEQRWRHAE